VLIKLFIFSAVLIITGTKKIPAIKTQKKPVEVPGGFKN